MKKLNILLTISFIVGLVASLYALYQLPSNLVQQRVIDLTQQPQIQPVLDGLYITIGIALAFGTAAVVGLWVERRETNTVTVSAQSNDKSLENLVPEQEAVETQTSVRIEGIEDIVRNEDDEEAAFTKALSCVCHQMEASQAAAYRVKHAETYAFIELFASFAYHAPEGKTITYRLGEGLAGQVAKQGECVIIDEVPEGYLEILSGLGKASPNYLMILPVKHEEQIVGVVEIASFQSFSNQQKDSIEEAFAQLALKLSNSDNVSLAESTSQI